MTETNQNSTEQVQEEWSTGSYDTLQRTFLPIAAELVDWAGVDAGDRVLDVACGTGNVALTAHRRGATVTGVDITPAMLAVARRRAAVVDADVDWREGDAAALSVDDAFDVTLSCLGHMFVPDQAAAASALVGATAAGGRVAFAAWTPGSNVAAMMGALAEHLPDQPDAPPPFRWGDPDAVRDLLGDRVEDLRFRTGAVDYPTLSPAHFWAEVTADSGPIILALERVDEARRAAIREDAVETTGRFFSDARNAVTMEYLLAAGRVA